MMLQAESMMLSRCAVRADWRSRVRIRWGGTPFSKFVVKFRMIWIIEK